MEYVVKVGGNGGPANQNTFTEMTLEPKKTAVAHVWASGPTSNFGMHGCRLEGSEQAADVPMVLIEDGSAGNSLTATMVGHQHIEADLIANPDVAVATHKALSHTTASGNCLTGQSTWEPAGFVSAEPAAVLFPGLAVEAKMVPSGSTVTWERPMRTGCMQWEQTVRFGAYVRAVDTESTAFVTMLSTGSMLSSSVYALSDRWQWVAMQVEAPRFGAGGSPDPKLRITAGGAPGGEVQIEVTAAGHWLGGGPPLIGAPPPLPATGGVLEGFLAGAPIVDVAGPDANNRMALPKTANVFRVGSGDSGTLQRVQDSGDRFPSGSQITLLFEQSISVKHGAYIRLNGQVDATGLRSLTLLSTFPPQWEEVARTT